MGFRPRFVVEPTCGVGSFLGAAHERFPGIEAGLGVDINPEYIARASRLLSGWASADLRVASFFELDWRSLLGGCSEPILVIGNPPWVTNAELASLGSNNIPAKSNFQGRKGFDAISGKSNFDIAEWMLIKLLEALSGRRSLLAMLCKTAVARRTLSHVWKDGLGVRKAKMFLIDAAVHFGAAVDACLLVCEMGDCPSQECEVYQAIGDRSPSHVFGCRDGQLVRDVAGYERWKHLRGTESYKWRSGVKHDCSKVMELRRLGQLYSNGLDEAVALEATCLYPMLKSSEIAKSASVPERWMLVTQESVGDDTSLIRERAPKTWEYLLTHADRLDRRGSSIYKGRPRFSVFGVGPYSFAPWKVAISGFYKKLAFAVVGPFEGRPVVLDDTAYCIPCESEEEARYVASLLSCEQATEFFGAYIFWDAKRPITVEILRRLDLVRLADEVGTKDTLCRFLEKNHYVDAVGHEDNMLFPVS